MTDTPPKVPSPPQLSQEQIDAIAGGECTPQEWIDIFGQLKTSYESLIDFTSYVIERVAGGNPTP